MVTIEERLEKLTARDEALTQTVEVLTHDLHEMKGLVNDIALGTSRLLSVAENHEKRLNRLEGGGPA